MISTGTRRYAKAGGFIHGTQSKEATKVKYNMLAKYAEAIKPPSVYTISLSKRFKVQVQLAPNSREYYEMRRGIRATRKLEKMLQLKNS